MTLNEIILSEYSKLRVDAYSDIIDIYVDDRMEDDLSTEHIRVLPEDFDVLCQGMNKINELLKIEHQNVISSDERHSL